MRDVLRAAGSETTLLNTAEAKRARVAPRPRRTLRRPSRRPRPTAIRPIRSSRLAGHGILFDGDADAYFCPRDARPFADETATLLSLAVPFEELDKSNAGVKFLLVDACRNKPRDGRGRGASGGVAPKAPVGVAALFSCKDGERADESDMDKHGVFFHHVLKRLRGEEPRVPNAKGDVTWGDLERVVCDNVAEDVPVVVGDGAQQSPTRDGKLSGKSPALLNPAKARTAAAFLKGIDADFGYNGAKQDRVEAAKWYGAAADLGHAAATCQLGYLDQTGTGVGRDDRKATELYRKAADLGDPQGMSNLAGSYERGTGVGKDLDAAVRWYRKAAAAGDDTAEAALERLGKE